MYAHPDLATGKTIAEKTVATFASCPIAELARLGRSLRQWKQTFLTYFTTNRSSNGGAEAVNGIVELHRRIARGYRNPDNYRLRMLLVAEGLDLTPHRKSDEPVNGAALDIKDAAGVMQTQWGIFVRSWAAAGVGGTLTVDTGSGGSYLNVKAYWEKLTDYLGVNRAWRRVGTGSPEGVWAAPIGSTYHRSDGGAGTSFYVKEFGAATSAGWVAK